MKVVTTKESSKKASVFLSAGPNLLSKNIKCFVDMEYQKPSGKKNELLDDLHCCCCCFVSFIAHHTMTVQLGLEILTWIAWTVLNWNELYHTVPLDTRIYCCSHIQSIVNSEAQTDRHEAKSPALLTFVGHFGGGAMQHRWRRTIRASISEALHKNTAV